ncbi:hypothetical protein [Microbacterium proteolyticum]|uniref:hypothetical protein n=1 Tax=Microbacterium proteolyticum TaxID=1572644 RepID=UPI0035C192F3
MPITYTCTAFGARLPWPMTRGRGRVFMLAYAALLLGGAFLAGLITVAVNPAGFVLAVVATFAWYFIVRAIAHRVIMRFEPVDADLRSERIREQRLAEIYG